MVIDGCLSTYIPMHYTDLCLDIVKYTRSANKTSGRIRNEIFKSRRNNVIRNFHLRSLGVKTDRPRLEGGIKTEHFMSPICTMVITAVALIVLIGLYVGD